MPDIIMDDAWFARAIERLKVIDLGFNWDELRIRPGRPPNLERIKELVPIYGKEYCRTLQREIGALYRRFVSVRFPFALLFLEKAPDWEYFDLMHPSVYRRKYRDHFRHAVKVMVIGEEILKRRCLLFPGSGGTRVSLWKACANAWTSTRERRGWIDDYLLQRYQLRLSNLRTQRFNERFVLNTWRIAALLHDCGRGWLAALQAASDIPDLPGTAVQVRREYLGALRDYLGPDALSPHRPSLFSYDASVRDIKREFSTGQFTHGTLGALYILGTLYKMLPEAAALRRMSPKSRAPFAVVDLACNLAAEAVWSHDKKRAGNLIKCPFALLLRLADEIDEFGRHCFDYVDSPRGLRQRRLFVCDTVRLSYAKPDSGLPGRFKAIFNMDYERTGLLTWFSRTRFADGKKRQEGLIRGRYHLGHLELVCQGDGHRRADPRVKVVLPARVSVFSVAPAGSPLGESACMIQDISRLGIRVRISGDDLTRMALDPRKRRRLNNARAEIRLPHYLNGHRTNSYIGRIKCCIQEPNAQGAISLGIRFPRELHHTSALGKLLAEVEGGGHCPDCCA